MKRFSLLLLLLFAVPVVTASNVAMTSGGVAVATRGGAGGLLTRDTTSDQASVEHDLPSGVSSLDDVSIDADNESLVFALFFSSSSPQVCSFTLAGTALTFVNCVGPFSVTPFSGVSARGGTLVISGGTGGLTVFSYDTNTGVIEASPAIENQRLPDVVGHPDVLMLDSSTTALSTDFMSDPPFGTMIVDVSDSSATALRDFRVQDSVEFSILDGGNTNFPLVNALYETDGGSFMYTANGGMTVQDPFVDGGTAVVNGAPAGFRAVTVAVNADKKLAVFGGLVNGPSQIVVYNLSVDPLNPTLLSTTNVEGRITSVASSGNVISYVTLPNPNVDIKVLEIEGSTPLPGGQPTMVPTFPVEGQPTMAPTFPVEGQPTMAPTTSGAHNTLANALYAFCAGIAGLAWVLL